MTTLGDASDEHDESGVGDDRLRLMFTCCHPALPLEAQVALTLRTLAGLTTVEIARAFLSSPNASGSSGMSSASSRARRIASAHKARPDQVGRRSPRSHRLVRDAQGLGAAMMTPAARSILTTSLPDDKDRIKAIGAWSATIPLASVIGVLMGGLLSEGPGWRWVFFVNLPVCAVVLAGASRLLDGDRRRATFEDFDAVGGEPAASPGPDAATRAGARRLLTRHGTPDEHHAKGAK